MSSEILINVNSGETRVALLENGVLVELYIERKSDQGITGNIYKGRVVRVLPGMQAAFVDIGLEKAAFLYVSDVHQDFEDLEQLMRSREEESNGLAPSEEEEVLNLDTPFHIEDLLHEGQEVLVQVSKEPLGTKGARITSHISLPGRHLPKTAFTARRNQPRARPNHRCRRDRCGPEMPDFHYQECSPTPRWQFHLQATEDSQRTANDCVVNIDNNASEGIQG